MNYIEIYNKKLNDGTEFVNKNLVELTILLKDWVDTGKLNNGLPCLLDDLVKILPDERNYKLAELLILSRCADEVIRLSKEKEKLQRRHDRYLDKVKKLKELHNGKETSHYNYYAGFELGYNIGKLTEIENNL